MCAPFDLQSFGGYLVSLNRVIRGSFWLYVSGITSNFLGYVYWLLASKFVPASTVGDAAAIIGVVSLITGIFGFGLSSGATRMFGRSLGHGDKDGLSRYFTSSIAFNIAVNTAVAFMIFFLGSLFGLSQLEIPYVTVLIVLGAFSPIPSAFYNSTLRTSAIALSSILSTVLRLVVGITLLYLGAGFVGVMVAYTLTGVVQDAVLLVLLKGQIPLSISTVRSNVSISTLKETLGAGIPNWIPSLVSTAGTWLGVIGVYAVTGSAQAGTYYIAFMISQIIYALPLSLLGLMFPVLSGMEDGRKRATSRSIRLTYAVIAPLSAMVIAYPHVLLSMLGTSYLASSTALQLLLIGCFVAPISEGFNSLMYAYGKYRYVTMLGLATNVPQIALYTVLVALWGANGAAISYISGMFIVLVAVLFMARKIGYSVSWGSSAAFAIIPASVAALMIFTGLNWVLGIVAILAVSAFAYARLGLITRSDVAEISSAFLSRKQLESLYPYTKYILHTLYGE